MFRISVLVPISTEDEEYVLDITKHGRSLVRVLYDVIDEIKRTSNTTFDLGGVTKVEDFIDRCEVQRVRLTIQTMIHYTRPDR